MAENWSLPFNKFKNSTSLNGRKLESAIQSIQKFKKFEWHRQIGVCHSKYSKIQKKFEWPKWSPPFKIRIQKFKKKFELQKIGVRHSKIQKV